MAASIGVLGYQAGDYLIVGTWPSVNVGSIWVPLFGPIPNTQAMGLGRVWGGLGGLPVVAVGMCLAYVSFLIRDVLRRR